MNKLVLVVQLDGLVSKTPFTQTLFCWIFCSLLSEVSQGAYRRRKILAAVLWIVCLCVSHLQRHWGEPSLFSIFQSKPLENADPQYTPPRQGISFRHPQRFGNFCWITFKLVCPFPIHRVFTHTELNTQNFPNPRGFYKGLWQFWGFLNALWDRKAFTIFNERLDIKVFLEFFLAYFAITLMEVSFTSFSIMLYQMLHTLTRNQYVIISGIIFSLLQGCTKRSCLAVMCQLWPRQETDTRQIWSFIIA